MPTNCPFCANNLFPYHKEIGVDIEQSIFWQDDYIYMTPDISPIGEGHYLIITKEHIPKKCQKQLFRAEKRRMPL